MARKNASAKKVGDVWVYSLDGKDYTEDEFFEAFPVKGKLITATALNHLKGIDVDTTRNWINS